ncbi:hypothetical protein RCH12_003727 [Cryobacterium sp. MP_3.1]|uniref:hypothetical protein n=1 Tax=Cryobacterium sp. MP_3.1 TaxID=3071711 RepID=UPI002E0382F0|nr:hypothetical protein [Cryobacterium sp. MP_3.1]
MALTTQSNVAPIFAKLEPYLTSTRLAPYMTAMNDDHKKAIQLYKWNLNLSGSVHQALQVFEVVLRNAMDVELCRWNGQETDSETGNYRNSDWLLDPAPLLARLVTTDSRVEARRRAARTKPAGVLITHADILAQLSMSTWRFLLPDRDPGRQHLWNSGLQNAFPNLSRSSDALVNAVEGIYALRNRVAHYEPLLRTTHIQSQMQAMRDVLKEIDVDVEIWFSSTQPVSAEMKRRPAP